MALTKEQYESLRPAIADKWARKEAEGKEEDSDSDDELDDFIPLVQSKDDKAQKVGRQGQPALVIGRHCMTECV